MVLLAEDHVGVAVQRRQVGVEGVVDRGDGGQRLVVDDHRVGPVLGAVRRVGDDGGDRLAHEARPRARQHRALDPHRAGSGEVGRERRDAVELVGAEGQAHAGQGQSRGHVDAADMRVRMLGAREREMQHALDGNVVEEPRAALEQNPVLHPRHPLADLPRKVGGRWARQGPTLYLWVHG